jgi:hypothetical protein
LATFRDFFLCIAFFAAMARDADTRVECLTRWCRTFFGAASAIVLSAKTAAHTRPNIFRGLRIMSVKITYLSIFGDTLRL